MQKVFENIIEKLEEIGAKKTCNKEKCDTKELCRICVVDDAIEIVKQEAEKYDNGWIPCSSGVMPRANGWYLVTNHLGVVQEQRWSANHWEKLRDDAVLAWRELPLPYQPKGE